MSHNSNSHVTVDRDGMRVHRIDTMPKVTRTPLRSAPSSKKHTSSTSRSTSSSSSRSSASKKSCQDKYRRMERDNNYNNHNNKDDTENTNNSNHNDRTKKRKLCEIEGDENKQKQRRKKRKYNQNNNNNTNKKENSLNKENKKNNKKQQKTKNNKKETIYTPNSSGVYGTLLINGGYDLIKYHNKKKAGITDAKKLYEYYFQYFQGAEAGAIIVYNLCNDTDIKFKQNNVKGIKSSKRDLSVNKMLEWAIERNGQIAELRAIKEQQKLYDSFVSNKTKFDILLNQKDLTQDERNQLINSDKMILKALRNEKGDGIDLEKTIQEKKEEYLAYFDNNNDNIIDPSNGSNLYWVHQGVTKKAYNEIKISQSQSASDNASNDNIDCPSPLFSEEPVTNIDINTNTNNTNTINANDADDAINEKEEDDNV